jgi:preprotein translocase SecE subunit
MIVENPREYLNKAVDFFSDVEVESKRVTWPSLKETVRSTGAVALISAILAAFLGLVDFLFSITVKFILS